MDKLAISASKKLNYGVMADRERFATSGRHHFLESGSEPTFFCDRLGCGAFGG
jgi:hypothetical protein